MTEYRTGVGWDVHRTGRNLKLVIGGVVIPCDFGLEGHSDADVLAHAITDALLGAGALGDIGTHFPDNDPRWAGADSLQFLSHARDLLLETGFQIVHIDSTVVLERPKMKDYRKPIREQIAATLELSLDQVSVKFKTYERVGPVGTELAVEAHAVVTVRRER